MEGLLETVTCFSSRGLSLQSNHLYCFNVMQKSHHKNAFSNFPRLSSAYIRHIWQNGYYQSQEKLRGEPLIWLKPAYGYVPGEKYSRGCTGRRRGCTGRRTGCFPWAHISIVRCSNICTAAQPLLTPKMFIFIV